MLISTGESAFFSTVQTKQDYNGKIIFCLLLEKMIRDSCERSQEISAPSLISPVGLALHTLTMTEEKARDKSFCLMDQN
jgi:hypothetical protein